MDWIDKDSRYLRQLTLLPPENLDGLKVTLIGAGGIGSPTALTLAKMGLPHLRIYDHDFLEPHNLSNQLYRSADLRRPKVEALSEVIGMFADTHIEPIQEMYVDQPLSGLIVSAVDSMAARKQIWKNVRYSPKVELYVEARMGAEVIMVYTINPLDPDQINLYEKTLYSDEGAFQAPCTAQAIMFTAMVCAGFIGNQIKKHANLEILKTDVTIDLHNYILIV
jgi:hypothetical protein